MFNNVCNSVVFFANSNIADGLNSSNIIFDRHYITHYQLWGGRLEFPVPVSTDGSGWTICFSFDQVFEYLVVSCKIIKLY